MFNRRVTITLGNPALRDARRLALIVLALCALLAFCGHPVLAALLLVCFCGTIPALVNGVLLGTNSATIKGDTTVVWGVGSFNSGSTTLSSTVTGILQSVRDGLTGEVVEVPDANGFTTAVVLFNHKDECELGVIIQTSAPVFTRGQVLTVGGLTNVVVLDYEKMWENKGVAKYNVKGTAWSGMPSP